MYVNVRKVCFHSISFIFTRILLRKMTVNLSDSPHTYGCPLPCTRVRFDLNLNYYHENTVDNTEHPANFTLLFFPSSDFIEEQVS
jgi:hypothetical protein